MKISLHNVTKTYGKQVVYTGINAEFDKDKAYPIIGNNGSGKSTLLQTIAGYISPNEGTITYHSPNGSAIPVENWYQHLSIAAPYLDLFDELSVLDSIELHTSLKPLTMSTLDLLDSIDLLDHKDKSLKLLSSGMRQRLKLALAIFGKTAVLLLDEPTSNLDAKWTQWLIDQVQSNRAGRIVIVCTNNQPAELEITDQEPLSLSV